MALKTVDQAAQVELIYSYYNKPLENVPCFLASGSPFTIAALEDLTDALTAWMVESYMPLFSNQLVLVSIYAKSLDLSNPIEFGPRLITQPGDVNEEGMSVNVAAQTQTLTGNIGRSFKGKWYSSGMGITAVDGNVLQGTFQTNLQSAFDALPTALSATVWQHGIVSRQQNKVTIDPAVITPVLTYAVSPIVHDMGRRLNNSF